MNQYDKFLLTAALEVGMTHSRCGFSFAYQFRKDPDIVNATFWENRDRSVTIEVPNALLLNADASFRCFGYEAEDAYSDLLEDDTTQDCYYFKGLKELFEQTENHSMDKIKDVTGRVMKSETVLSFIIKYLKDRLEESITRSSRLNLNRRQEIYWVITLPTTISESTLGLFRDSAIKAGLDDKQTSFILASEAAVSFFTNVRHVEKTYADMIQRGTQFMVVDVGGEMTNMTVYQRLDKEAVKELFNVCNKSVTGNAVDEALKKVFIGIFGQDILTEFSKIYTDNYHTDFFSSTRLRINFETMYSKIRLPAELRYACEEIADTDFKQAMKNSSLSEDLSILREQVLTFSPNITKQIYAPICDSLVHFMRSVPLESKFREIQAILLVESFYSNRLVQQSLRQAFPEKLLLIDKQEYHNVETHTVLRGAVMFGRAPFRVERLPWFDRYKVSLNKEDDPSLAGDFEDDEEDLASDCVNSLRYISLSSDSAEDSCSGYIDTGVASLTERISGLPQDVMVRRSEIVSDVIALYKDLDVSRPLRVTFAGEEGTDDGGLTKDMFGLFWEKVGAVWFRGENSIIPFVAPAKRPEARRVFPVLGKILEHMLCLVGHFPPQFCRSLALAIAHPDEDIDPDLVMDDYFLFLPETESNLLQKCLVQQRWSENQKKRLLRFFSINKMSATPTPKTLRDDLVNIAHAEIIDASHIYTGLMRRGLSEFALEKFFRLLDTAGIRSMYASMAATPEKVAQLVDDFCDRVDLRGDEEIVINHLSNFIGNLDQKKLRRFLVWLTGSSSMPQKIDITFNASRGIARAPVAHTCSNLLELPRQYSSFQDFEREFLNILQNDASFTFTVSEGVSNKQ